MVGVLKREFFYIFLLVWVLVLGRGIWFFGVFGKELFFCRVILVVFVVVGVGGNINYFWCLFKVGFW